MKNEALKILLLEDNEADADIILRVLKKEMQDIVFRLVMSKDAYMRELDEFMPDIILADYSLPQFNATEALEILNKRSLFIPLIIVSGTISEDFAEHIIKRGANDYILKDRLARLPAVIKDILEKKGINQRLYDTNQTLQIANKELEQFAYITSHDLQEPLRTILSCSEFLLNEYNDKLGGNGEKYLGFILESSKRMRELVTGLLDYSRIGNEKKEAQIDCNRMVADVLVDLAEAIKECNSHIHIQQLPVLNAYPTELRQLFQNLVSNAIKYRHKDVEPQIHIKAEEQSKHWLFAIQDNGIGINELDKEKVFIIFKRLHNRNEYEGTGIGLAHCKKIVELHGGKIWVESTPGIGSTFYFTVLKK